MAKQVSTVAPTTTVGEDGASTTGAVVPAMPSEVIALDWGQATALSIASSADGAIIRRSPDSAAWSMAPNRSWRAVRGSCSRR